jgi:hypothetical protein
MLRLAFGVSSVERSGLTLSGDFPPALKGETWRRRTGQFYCLREKEGRGEMAGLFFFNEFFFF